MRLLRKIFAVVITVFMMWGCDSNSDVNADTSVTGQFVDDPVSGLTYTCSSGLVGSTDIEGKYTCENGDNVTFYIGKLVIGTVTAGAGIVTPYSLFPSNLDAALNLARLLQSFDTNTSDDTITLDVVLVDLLDVNTDFTSPTFAADVESDLAITLVSVQDAQIQLNETIVTAGGNIPDGANMPVADAGVDQNIHNNDLVTLNGSASFDADGDALTYAWSIKSKPAASEVTLSSAIVVNPTFTADESGIYVVELIVNDGTVDSALDAVTITATATFLNVAPIANAGADQNVNTNDSVDLNGSGSSDADLMDTLYYNWTINSKPASSNAVLSNATVVNPSFEVDLEGTYEIQLIVNDGTVDSALDVMVVTATTANAAPIANSGSDQAVNTNDTVTLSGSGSIDADSDILTYLWNLTSKPSTSTAVLSSTTAEEPTFTADLAGAYVIGLIVNDGTVASAPDTITVTVTDNTTPAYNTVTSPYTGKIWHDRNLGATRVCTSITDTACYGDYYQWGRNTDGHQKFGSATIAIQTTDVINVGHSDFIAITAYPYDWGSNVDSSGATRKTNWSATDGRSVCPIGFRLPTRIELNNEILNGDIGYSVTPYNSFLKLPSAGSRYADSGTMYGQGSIMYLWSSDVSGVESYSMYYTGYADIDVTTDVARGGGIAVRCIKN
ncbi:PKD domain-containing protein [Psychromonas antarctica]|uniref:PKD domain-containing protein n=1 Tax=Psychromonas antarctica TaxID=67573 RepID=UPI001EE7F196|nr:PKD domain-containing protein [Psychromonas antarctica]MCG6202296.1 PKD domain-containing protein [Psychromonas antarctica]